MALPVLIRTHKAIRAAHVEVLSGSAATGAVFAELFMIKSLLVFNPKAKATDDDTSASPRWNTSMVIVIIPVHFAAFLLLFCWSQMSCRKVLSCFCQSCQSVDCHVML